MKLNLKATTPVGEFTRATFTPYTHVVVWNSPRAAKYRGVAKSWGVSARWAKDNGYGVTWHSSEAAAQKAAKAGYKWDAADATLVGIFSVQS